MLVKHIKTGTIYEVLMTGIIDATNATEGREMVVYWVENSDDDLPRKVFTREATEFWLKFDREPDRCCSCGTTENLYRDGSYGYRCKSYGCMVF